MEIRPYLRKAQYYETDQMGVIHHANYIHWFEEARIDFMAQIGFGYDESIKSGIDFGMLSLSCDYKSMARFGEEVEVRAEITALTLSRMTVRYTVRNSESGEVRCTGETHHFYYDNRKKRPVSLKKAIPELYALFLTLVVKDAAE